MFVIVLLAAVSADKSSENEAELQQIVAKRSAMHFCGAALTDALELVCQYRMGKRSRIGEFPKTRNQVLRVSFGKLVNVNKLIGKFPQRTVHARLKEETGSCGRHMQLSVLVPVNTIVQRRNYSRYQNIFSG